MRRVISLTTDFGLSDGFVGTMKGVILTINPEATIVDITHEIAPQNVEQGGFILAASIKYLPPNAVHVVVVDPGVGSTRRPIAVQVGETIFVAPDNGVISEAIEERRSVLGHPPVHAVHLDRPEYWVHPVSRTFHGRDIFSPCGAHLSLGAPLQSLGTPIDDWIRLVPEPPLLRDDGALMAYVRHIDRFGNIVINVRADVMASLDPRNVQVRIAGRTLRGLHETYSEAAPGELLALISSNGDLEVAARDANAAKLLDIHLRDKVLVVP